MRCEQRHELLFERCSSMMRLLVLDVGPHPLHLRLADGKLTVTPGCAALGPGLHSVTPPGFDIAVGTATPGCASLHPGLHAFAPYGGLRAARSVQAVPSPHRAGACVGRPGKAHDLGPSGAAESSPGWSAAQPGDMGTTPRPSPRRGRRKHLCPKVLGIENDVVRPKQRHELRTL